jgi:spermidine synthase
LATSVAPHFGHFIVSVSFERLLPHYKPVFHVYHHVGGNNAITANRPRPLVLLAKLVVEQSIFTYVFLSCNIALVKPLELLGQALSRDGTVLKLIRRGDEYIILANGKSLMSSLAHGSEEAMATFACRKARTMERPSVLIGGLGMGFTLRAALDLLPPDAIVIVAELVPAVVEWNRGPLGPLAGQPLKDTRVRVEIDDVAVTLHSSPGQFDAVLLDVDNGPTAFSASSNNAALYDDRGIATAFAALKMDGVLAVWSAREDRKFEQRLRHGRFAVQVEHVRGRLKKGGARHTIFLGQKSPGR